MENELIERQSARDVIYNDLIANKSVVLPCMVGDEVWVNTGYDVVHTRKVTVDEIIIIKGAILISGSYKQWLYEERDVDGVLIKAKNPPETNKWWWESKTRVIWGKGAFSTREEANRGKTGPAQRGR